MSGKIVLYDLPSRGRCACWSPNVWKTRMVLNYKNLPYRTEWIEHPDIPLKFKELGVEPNSPSAATNSPYTVPMLQLPDGTTVMESTAIAAKLESLHPDPPLHLSNGLLPKIGPLIGKIAQPLIPVFMPRIGRDVLLESSVPYFQEARAKRFGMSLDELERTKGGQQAWEAAEPGLVELEKYLQDSKQDDGPFVLGSQVCYADFVIASMVESLRRIGEDLYEKTVRGHQSLARVHQACEMWLKEDQ